MRRGLVLGALIGPPAGYLITTGHVLVAAAWLTTWLLLGWYDCSWTAARRRLRRKQRRQHRAEMRTDPRWGTL